MFYKVEKGSELYDKLAVLSKESQEAHKATHEFVFDTLKNEFGVEVKEYCAGKFNDIGSKFYTHTIGGFIRVVFKGEVPKGWGKSGDGYFPKNIKANKALLERIHALPAVSNEAINDIINFRTAWDDNSNRFSSHPGYKLATKEGEPHLLHFSDWVIPKHYQPIEGMTEITKTEYDTISNRD